MKVGIRKPNIKSSIKARTTGKAKRAMKRAVNPLYGKKGMGVINDPKKAVYNAAYQRTTVSAADLATGKESKRQSALWGVLKAMAVVVLVAIVAAIIL